ncbi:nucleoside hydrolase-like domain-containing protein [Catalinimonas sp. 4WD22]|uniref:nucleoside hydrolase-like domain-containing protein n=1 Tax=Catalinimonas locisalis TaxID=3133978 RepID=UPI003100FB16
MRFINHICFLLLFCLASNCYSISNNQERPQVFIFTDINIDQGDPDDRQSLVHLLWYADEVDIKGIVPDRWNAQGMEACQLAIDAYAQDYNTFAFKEKSYPTPEHVGNLLASDLEDALARFKHAADNATPENPLYVLVWGNMQNIGKALQNNPELAKNIRLITIGTGLKYGPEDEVAGEDCTVPNWNGPGRNTIYQNEEFDEMWWLEINWTYNGMFSGNGPKEMFEKLSSYGYMGSHMKYVTKNQEWAQYFRVGDTPSVLYVIDPNHDIDDPTQSSWAGKFKKPFPQERPNYYIDDNGPVEWNYADPCKTWENLKEMYEYNKSTLETGRPEMYEALLTKLDRIYGRS